MRVVYCDITKAFDKVYHPALLYKLRKAGICGSLLEWFTSYLNDRTQRVVLKGESSDWGGIEAGVPQGSVLGPLLFLVFVNDITGIVTSNIRLFADDVTLFITVDDPTESSNIINNDMTSIENWSSQWLVTFNPRKTKTMLVSKKRNRVQHPNISFSGEPLENVSQQTHLGVTFSSDLSWTNHITYITCKARKLIGILKFLQYKLTRRSLELIYLSYIRPILEYGDVVWSGCTTADAELLESVQLAAARAVTGGIRCTSHVALYNETGWETLAKRRDKHRLKLLYKIINGFTPGYLHDLIPSSVFARNSYNVRSKNNISEVYARTNLYSNSFIPAAIREWNKLPLSFRNSEDVVSFQSKLNKDRPKINELYYLGNRKVNVIHSRIRMGCSQLNQDMYKIGVMSSPTCACGISSENAYHYFFECSRFTRERNILQMSILCLPGATFTLNTLLHGGTKCSKGNNKIIFEAVHSYIVSTARFS